MRQYTRVENLSEESECKLLRDRLLYLKKQMNSTESNDTSIFRLVHQAEMKMLQSELKILRNAHKKTLI